LVDHLWVFDLIAPDERVRHRALARHQALTVAAGEALQWSNRVWERAGTPAPVEPHLSAEMDQARADHRWYRDQTISGLLDGFWRAAPPDTVARAVYAPFVVLFLRWETRFPDEWRAPDSCGSSPWTTKEGVLRRLGRDGVPDEVRPAVADLVLAAVGRPYRCKDWRYAQVVRHVCDEHFTDRLDALLADADPLVRLCARFTRYIAAHPGRPVTRVSWQTWLATDRPA
jgi:hypothetical protein